jgi:D-alanyl-D-alanine carboxypeptidase (penicillin-binding protein 5/6)
MALVNYHRLRSCDKAGQPPRLTILTAVPARLVIVLTSYGRRRNAPPEPLYIGFGVVAAIVFFAIAMQMLRGMPDPAVNLTFPETTTLGEPRTPPFPQDGQAIVSVVGLGTIGQSGPVQSRPIASVTKIMTAYVLLKEHPLTPGQSGPSIEVTTADADRFWVMVAQDQSVQPVNAGQILTELQLLQGMLIPRGHGQSRFRRNCEHEVDPAADRRHGQQRQRASGR